MLNWGRVICSQTRLLKNHQRKNEWHVSNVYMQPPFLWLAAQHFPVYLYKGCVTVSIHHPDMGALIETARPDPVSGWWHICHSTQWGVWASSHLSLSKTLKPHSCSIKAKLRSSKRQEEFESTKGLSHNTFLYHNFFKYRWEISKDTI